MMDNAALFKIGYGLYVLTAQDGEKDNGCIINTLLQVTSNAPFIVLISINKRNYTYSMIEHTKVFNVSMLTEEVPFKVFQHFGFQSGTTVDKFKDYSDVKRSEGGPLYLTKYSNAYITCKVLDAYDFDTHIVYKAELVEAVKLSDAKSVTYDYYQANIKPKPAPVSAPLGYRCKICNYVYDGVVLPSDFICPICKHGAADFEKITK
jgi:flavin reductase (DIM6/NTAB) family NADH-FMN oxidoreductase RutF/rubredoxin